MPLSLNQLNSLARTTNVSQLRINSQGDVVKRSAIGGFFSKIGDAFRNMSSAGRAAVMENWNGMLKSEWYYHPDYRRDKHLITPSQAMKEVRAYVEYWNNERIQARLKYRSPKEFREAILSGRT